RIGLAASTCGVRQLESRSAISRSRHRSCWNVPDREIHAMTSFRHATIDSASSTGLDVVRVLTANHRSAGLEALARMSLSSTAQEALAHRLDEMGLEAALL